MQANIQVCIEKLKFFFLNKNLNFSTSKKLVLIWKDSFLKWAPSNYENVTQLILKSSVICNIFKIIFKPSYQLNFILLKLY